MDVHADGEDEDGGEAEEDDGVDEDGHTAGLQVTELHHPALGRKLEQQPRREQHEEHHSHKHRPPVCHLTELQAAAKQTDRVAAEERERNEKGKRKMHIGPTCIEN